MLRRSLFRHQNAHESLDKFNKPQFEIENENRNSSHGRTGRMGETYTQMSAFSFLVFFSLRKCQFLFFYLEVKMFWIREPSFEMPMIHDGKRENFHHFPSVFNCCRARFDKMKRKKLNKVEGIQQWGLNRCWMLVAIINREIVIRCMAVSWFGTKPGVRR